MILHNYYTNGAVIQQNMEILISGISERPQNIAVKLIRDHDKKLVSESKAFVGEGIFNISLDPIKASCETYTMYIDSDSENICITDLVAGEVFLTSGQSNMEFGVGGCIDKDEIFEMSKNSDVRFILCKDHFSSEEAAITNRSPEELYNITYNGWKRASSLNDVANLSAISMVFAAEMEKVLNIPIGIIDTAVGGTTIEAWMSRKSIDSDSFVKNHLVNTNRYAPKEIFNSFGERNYSQATGLYNERIAPLSHINIGTIVWLQGESSANDEVEAAFYTKALDLMINDWNWIFRHNIPFIAVDIAAHNYQFAPLAVSYLNEAIHNAIELNNKNRVHIPIYDLPLEWMASDDLNSHPIHPSVKAPVGKRLAKVVLNKFYNVQNGCEVPKISEIHFEEKGAILRFEGISEKLVSLDGNIIRGFTVCGSNKIHIEANAEIIDYDKVKVYNEFIDRCEGITYAFSLYNQKCNLANSEGIPVIPFRTKFRGDIYFEPRYWMCCDYESEWENCFEWKMGGAKHIPLWSVGIILGSKNVVLRFDTKEKSEGISSLEIQYKTDFKNGYFLGVSPRIVSAGKFHALNRYNYMLIDIKNPDDREKSFLGVLIRTLDGKMYRLPVYENNEYKSETIIPAKGEFITYKIALNRFLGCYSILEGKTPNNMSDVYEMQFTWYDKSEDSGRLYIDNIRLMF